MAYTLNNKEYPFLAKDELERQLPVLKKAYLKYSEVAGKDIKYMFYDLFKDYVELKAEELGSTCYLNTGNGKYTKMGLPTELQFAPIYSFLNHDGNIIGMGNLYGVIPFEGRYDALQPTAFQFSKNNFVTNATIKLPIDGEIRDVKWIHYTNNRKILVVARNNENLLFYEPSRLP
jgi:hypothetical protein